MNGNPKKFFLLYLGILSLSGGVVIYLAASKVGPGISNDAAMMLSVAGNLVKSHDMVDFRGAVLTQFPPLYPLLLSMGSTLFGMDVVVVGWYLNIFVFCAIIWFSGLLFWSALSDRPLFAYFASFVIFSSTSIIKISANIASDPLFMLIVIFFLMSLGSYMATGQNKYLIFSGILIVIGCSQRYAGLSLIPAGGLVVAYKNRDDIRTAIQSVLLFALPTALPAFVWGYFHNYPINGSVFGQRIEYMPILNFIAGSEKLLNWFIPTKVVLNVGPLILYAVILCLIAFVILRTGAINFLTKINSPLIIPHIAFLFIYFGVLTFNITPELQGVETDRAHIIILPSLLIILGLVSIQFTTAAEAKFGPSKTLLFVTILFFAWSVYPITKTIDYVQRSSLGGDVSSYNSLNKAGIKNMSLTRYLSGLEIKGNKFYSNGEAAVWFTLRVQVNSLPQSNSGRKPSLSYLEEHYSGWPGPGNDGYLIWFNDFSYKEYLATPDELNSIAALTEIYSDENGSIYYLKSR